MAIGTAPQRRTGGLFEVKSTDAIVADTEENGRSLRRAVGALDLTALGIGAIIGTGIFVIIGEAIGKSGPAIVISFALAGVTCLFSALSYAELAAMIPVSGSAYTYSYATLGELVAWIIGWDLILEYGFSVAVVAVGWGGYLNTLLGDVFGATLPDAIASPPGDGGVFNLPAVFLVLLITGVLIVGVRESARFNAVMVVIKLAILAFFVVLGFTAIKSQNYSPFAPKGFSGIADAAALIFFAYIGFDAVSTSGEEAKRPKRDLPIAIVGSLVFCTIVYVLVSIAAVAVVPPDQLAGGETPLLKVVRAGAPGFPVWIFGLITMFAVANTALLNMMMASRLVYGMAREKVLPAQLGGIHAVRRTPRVAILFTTALALLLISLVGELPMLAGTTTLLLMCVFAVVNVAVLVQRKDRVAHDHFRTPTLFPIVGVMTCVLMVGPWSGRPAEQYITAAVLLALGGVLWIATRASTARG